MPEESNDKIDDGVASHVRAWDFKGDETMHPSWVVERLTDDERREAHNDAFNMKLIDLEFEFPAVTVGALGTDSIAITFALVVPIMTSAVAVKKGEELFLEHATRKEPKRKDGPWNTDVAKANQAPKVKARAKPAASSLDVVTEILSLIHI